MARATLALALLLLACKREAATVEPERPPPPEVSGWGSRDPTSAVAP